MPYALYCKKCQSVIATGTKAESLKTLKHVGDEKPIIPDGKIKAVIENELHETDIIEIPELPDVPVDELHDLLTIELKSEMKGE